MPGIVFIRVVEPDEEWVVGVIIAIIGEKGIIR
jgi:hypothetical protein